MGLDIRPSLRVGLLSDTHLPHRMKRLPTEMFDVFDGVDVILHAGDVDRPVELDPLREMVPVYAVRGNVHFLDLSSGGVSLPRQVELHLAGRRVLLTHGHSPGLESLWVKGWDVVFRLVGASDKGRFNKCIACRLGRLYPGADVIVFGHTHRAYVGWMEDTLVVNPGAVAPTLRERPSVARMWLGHGEPEVEVVPL